MSRATTFAASTMVELRSAREPSPRLDAGAWGAESLAVN
jgi:hypothetical protein